MVKQTFLHLMDFLRSRIKYFIMLFAFIIVCMFIALAIGKIYQSWDDDEDRGSIPITDGHFQEDYSTPVYLEQGWNESDSLWYYNITQGSDLIPYDFFMELEQPGSTELFRSDANFDKYRYLPQKATFFNPDGLAVGFVKDTYKGKDYIGYTCAACHTGQINYQGKAVRIDGGAAMADMVGFLTEMETAMRETLNDTGKQDRFVKAVLERDNDYRSKTEVLDDLKKWANIMLNYNSVNMSSLEYGYARLDAFGRIYNRVLQHVINKKQARNLMLIATDPDGKRILTEEQVDLVLDGINETIIGNQQFAIVIDRLISDEKGYPDLNFEQMIMLRGYLFNEPNAPVSYPYLWDITNSDYVQWNALANNAGVGPLGRNAGEVTGVFAILDWEMSDGNFSLGAKISGQDNKTKQIDFSSSIDLVNLQRIENHLKSLKSPLWPEDVLGKIDQQKAHKGELLYAQYCQSCHEIIDRNNWNRVVISKLSSLDRIGTDTTMAENSVNFVGKSGNFEYTYQSTGVGDLILGEEAPVAAILTATTRGVVATPDVDKNWMRRWLDWLYTLFASFFYNDIKASMKQGQYKPDTTAQPFQSLLAYKARPLNGIWATAPFLHNGSVPSLYDLLLPAKRDGDPEDGEYRPTTFKVGSREFDPAKVGFRTSGYDGFEYDTTLKGNFNTGHEYAAGKTKQPNGEVLPAMTREQRLQLLEFIKTL